MYKKFKKKWKEQKMMHLPDGRRTRMTAKSPHTPDTSQSAGFIRDRTIPL